MADALGTDPIERVIRSLLDENAKLRDLVDRNRYALRRTFSANDWRDSVSDACSDIDSTLARLDPTRAEVTGRG